MSETLDRDLLSRARGHIRRLVAKWQTLNNDQLAEDGELIEVASWGVNPRTREFSVHPVYNSRQAIVLDDGVYLLSSGQIAVRFTGGRGFLAIEMDEFVNDLIDFDRGTGAKTDARHVQRVNQVCREILDL